MSEPLVRCSWCVGDPLYEAYHDQEWGVPVYDDQQLFERLMLEGFQAGLAWITILRKRERFFSAFDGWNPEIIAAYGQDDVDRLMADAGIIRNRLKIEGAVKNARAYLRLQENHRESGSFSEHIWSFVGGTVKRAAVPPQPGQIAANTPESDAMSKDLKQRGFTFVGSTICYAFMQSAGLVDDHHAGCWKAVHRSPS